MHKLSKKIQDELARVAGETRTLAETISNAHSDAENYADERSFRWQESDRGAAYMDWVSRLSDLYEQLENISEEMDNTDINNQPEEMC